MNKLQLQEILSAPFDLENWRHTLAEVINVKHFHRQPQPINLQSNDKAEAAYELGSFETEDGTYKILLHLDCEKNRKGISGSEEL